VYAQQDRIHRSRSGFCCSWVYENPRFVGDSRAHDRHGGAPPLDYTHMGMPQLLPNGHLAVAWQVPPPPEIMG